MRVKAIVSAAGLDSAENDDCAGFAETGDGLFAWVIDGATNIAGREFLGAGRGDAAWYAHALSKRLEANAASGLALAELHATAAREVAEDYRELRSLLRAPPPAYALPMAAVTMVRVSDGHVELYELGTRPLSRSRPTGTCGGSRRTKTPRTRISRGRG